MKKAAVLGAGFSGLASAWFLLQNPEIEVTLFDPVPIGKGTSGIAAGLMHPYAGSGSTLAYQGWEGWNATCNLLAVAAESLGEPVANFCSLLKPALTQEQQEQFFLATQENSALEWWDSARCAAALPEAAPFPALFEPTAAVVDCARYLQGMWEACRRKGAQLIPVAIKGLDSLTDYEYVIVALGAFSKELAVLNHPRITPVKGQVLEVEWPRTNSPLPFPLISEAYLVMNEATASCLIGGTYERRFTSEEPDPKSAWEWLGPKATAIFPSLKDAKIIGCKAGVRATTPNRRPFIGQIAPRCWSITGMGSKGLLYHALYARQLVALLESKKFL